MKSKILSVVTGTFLLISVGMAGASTTLMQIGRSPFYQPPLTTSGTLVSMVHEQQADVKRGFEKAGRPDLFEPFVTQIGSAEIDLMEFQKGSHFEWMFFKKKGKGTVRVAKDVTWGNEQPFSGFKLAIDSEGKRYTFAVPLGCGNIALMGVAPIPVAPTVPVVIAPDPVIVPANLDPQCGMTVSSVRAFCGDIITVDASSSSDSDGEITKMTIAFVDDQGQVVSEKIVDGNNLIADVEMVCGTNTLTVNLVDNDGAEATSSECSVEVTGQSRARLLADVGYYRQFDPAHYMFGRVGLEYKFTEQFGLLAMVGGAGKLEGLDGASAFMADVLAEYSFSRYFVDFGVGAWITDGDDDLDAENSQLDLIAAVGARVFGEPEEFNGSLFLEVRSGVDELGDLIDYGRFGVGMRFRF